MRSVQSKYGMLVDELFPDNKVDLYLIESESIILPAEIDSKPFEWSTKDQKQQRLSHHRKLVPLTIEINGSLHPGTWLNPDFTSIHRPVADKASRLVFMRNQSHTYKYYTTTFYGLPYPNMTIKELNLRNDPTSGSVVPYTLVLQESLNREVPDAGKQFVDAVGNSLMGLATALGTGVQNVLGGARTFVESLATHAGYIIDGFLSLFRGSLPWQRFKTRINGKTFQFEVYWDTVDGRPVFSMSDTFNTSVEKARIVTEVPMILWNNLLADAATDPRVKGIYIIPIPRNNSIVDITEDNIGDRVQLVVLTGKTLSELAALKARGARVLTVA